MFLVQALRNVAAAAIGSAHAARLRSGVGHVDLFLNRRTRGHPNHVDRRVAVLAVDAADSGAPLAVLFGVGCHPVTMGWDHNEISADFPGVAQRANDARGYRLRSLGPVDATPRERAGDNIIAHSPAHVHHRAFRSMLRVTCPSRLSPLSRTNSASIAGDGWRKTVRHLRLHRFRKLPTK
jgi:hypothetical protein